MEEDTIKTGAIICDLDGVLCDSQPRQHKGFIRGRIKYKGNKDKVDWSGFYKTIKVCKPNYWCEDLLYRFRDYQILIVTGRPREPIVYRDTMNWLRKWNIPRNKVFFRDEHDYREDNEVKKDIYNNFIKPNYDVLFVLEDRQQVVDMYRELGLTVLQCDEGNF